MNAPVNCTVCMSVRPSRKVCITHNSETGCTIDLKLHRYRCLGYENTHLHIFIDLNLILTYRLMALDKLKKFYFQFVSCVTLNSLYCRLETSQICCLGYEDAHLYIFIHLNLLLTDL